MLFIGKLLRTAHGSGMKEHKGQYILSHNKGGFTWTIDMGASLFTVSNFKNKVRIKHYGDENSRLPDSNYSNHLPTSPTVIKFVHGYKISQ